MNHDHIRTELLKQDCDWINFKTNTQGSSHMGGVWERQIRSVRTVLSSLLSSTNNANEKAINCRQIQSSATTHLLRCMHMNELRVKNGKKLYPISDKQRRNTQFQAKMSKIHTHFQTKMAQKPYCLGQNTYLACIREYPLGKWYY